MTVPSTREPLKVPVSQITRGLNVAGYRVQAKQLLFKAGN